MTVENFREMTKLFMQHSGEAADVSFKNMTEPARDKHQIPMRIYNDQLDFSRQVFSMYPGCGYLLDLFELNAIVASRIAKYADIKMLPENIFIGGVRSGSTCCD
jgi:hypothetical protein